MTIPAAEFSPYNYYSDNAELLFAEDFLVVLSSNKIYTLFSISKASYSQLITFSKNIPYLNMNLILFGETAKICLARS
jgi:hypothetical protein